MNAENLSVDDGAEREIVEDFRAVAPDGDGTVLAQTFVVEAVDLSDLSRLVITAYQHNSVGVTNFEGEEKQKRFHAVEPAIDEIAQKEVVCLWNIPANFEKFL